MGVARLLERRRLSPRIDFSVASAMLAIEPNQRDASGKADRSCRLYERIASPPSTRFALISRHHLAAIQRHRHHQGGRELAAVPRAKQFRRSASGKTADQNQPDESSPLEN